jgi:PAS domain S-box-containing protein
MTSTLRPRLPRRRFPQGIQGRLILLLCTLLIPTLLIQIYIYYDRFQTRRTEELQANLELARAVAKNFETFVKDTLHQELSIGLALASKDLSQADKDRILNASKEENHAIWELFSVNAEGFVIAATGSQFIGMQLGDRPYFTQIVSGQEWAISELLLSRTTQRPSFTLSRGIRDGRGELLGILVAGILPERLDEVLGIQRSKDAGVSILDSNGTLVYRYPLTEYAWEQRNWRAYYPEIEEALQAKEIMATVVSHSDGKSRLVGFTPIPSCGWVAAASRGEGVTMAAIHATLLPQACIFLIITIAILAVALASTRNISTSIEKLRDHALAVGRGESPDPEAVSGTVELGDLASAFTKMTEDMQSRENERKRAEEALRESEQRFRLALRNAPVSVAAQDRDLRYIWAYNQRTGRPNQIIGHFDHEIFTPNEAARITAIKRRVLDEGIELREQMWLDRPSGRIFLDICWEPIRDEAGRVTGVASATVDLTPIKLAEEAVRASEEKAHNLIRFAPAAIYETDILGSRFISVNDIACQWTGYSREEFLALKPTNLVDEEGRIRFQERVRRKLAGESISESAEYKILTKDGHPLIGSVNVGSVTHQDGKPYSVLVIAHNITERKRMEDELRKSRDELEQRVRERTAELELRNQELQNFTFVASHDLQEPLRKLQTFGDIINTRWADSIGEQGRDYVKRMGETAGRMQALLHSLLEYSRLTSKAQPFARVKLKGIVEAVLSDLEVQVKEAKASVEIGDLPEMEADAAQIASLFQNLIGNAIKFRRDEDPPRIKIHCNSESDSGSRTGQWEILVEDNGIGFDEEYLDLIFRPFQRLHGRKKYAGVGMGLAICKKVVERHGGTITARSTPGQGATFIVRLPKKR